MQQAVQHMARRDAGEGAAMTPARPSFSQTLFRTVTVAFAWPPLPGMCGQQL